jgi:hypothetical protein
MHAYFNSRFCKPVLLAALLALALVACGDRHKPNAATFVGKWRSSKFDTPLFLYANGEWEVKLEDGSVLQYGIWEYRDGNITWSVKIGSKVRHDVNSVVSANDREFRLKEGFQVTVFERLD